MSEAPRTNNEAAHWLESLERGKAEVAAGHRVKLLPILEEMRALAEKLEAEMGIDPDSQDGLPTR